MSRAAVIGTGLIGASIGLGLRAVGWHVTGFDQNREVLESAAERGALVAVGNAIEDTVDEALLVVVATPPAAVAGVLGELQIDALVTDVAGIKAPVLASAGHLPRFVGGHPMAGREASGPQVASAGLFRGATWVVTTDGAADSDLDEIEAIIRLLGARPMRMSAAAHDAAVARISHVPQVLAAVLLEMAAGSEALDLAAGSFRDLTRVAASPPGMWSQLLAANAAAVIDALDEIAGRLGDWREMLEGGEIGDAVTGRLSGARQLRLGLSPPVVQVGVSLDDRPGELARVGRALAASAVDIRDLQLRHAPHGGGGVLTLAVRPGEAEALRSALAEEGLAVLG